MPNMTDKYEKCPFCKKYQRFFIADTPAVRRTYCPNCLQDIEVIWKEKR